MELPIFWPLSRPITKADVDRAYEANPGAQIVFLDPGGKQIPIPPDWHKEKNADTRA